MQLKVHVCTNGSNTFIQLAGHMSAGSLQPLTEALCGHRGQGRYFIGTDSLTVCNADARPALREALRVQGIAPASLYFKGKYAFAMAPDGCRVITLRDSAEGGAHTRSRRRHGRLSPCAHGTSPSHAAHEAHGPHGGPASEHSQEAHNDAQPHHPKRPGCTGNCATCPHCRHKRG